MDAVLDFFKSLPSTMLDLILHPPFKPDPTVKTTLIGVGMVLLVMVGSWAWNRFR
jgi:hypothetical protein